MKKINFNMLGKMLVFFIIIFFTFINPYKETVTIYTVENDLFYIGSNLYLLSKSIVLAGAFIALSMLFKNADNKK